MKGECLDRTVLQAIQGANAASMGAMETYLLFAAGPEALGDPEQMRGLLERSLYQHGRVIEHLELAARRLEMEPPAAAD